jgi:hypothetical protein
MPENLLHNHDLENGHHWYLPSGVLADRGNTPGKLCTPAAGPTGLQDPTADSYYYRIAQDINLTKGEEYTFSAYAKTENVSSQYRRVLCFRFVTGKKAGAINYVKSSLIRGTNDWQRLSVTFTLPANAMEETVQFALFLIRKPVRSGTIACR